MVRLRLEVSCPFDLFWAFLSRCIILIVRLIKWGRDPPPWHDALIYDHYFRSRWLWGAPGPLSVSDPLWALARWTCKVGLDCSRCLGGLCAAVCSLPVMWFTGEGNVGLSHFWDYSLAIIACWAFAGLDSCINSGDRLSRLSPNFT